ncbi:MAG: UDP-N-acetylglucosamine:LPS N-acetylglucosamine transferase [Candidatus Azotimanducaceae bacterium]|jgi:UDP-N-acetylglucosamine:LPS N-acetylglucosamine transferase
MFRTKQPKILAVASGGGHWLQLLRLRPAFGGIECIYASVNQDQSRDVDPDKFYLIPEANRDTKIMLLLLCLKLTFIILKVRPTAIVSAGAAPGYLAIRIGQLVGAKGLFIDSIANAEKLSLSGELASHHADLMLTQWPALSRTRHVKYRGSVIHTTKFGDPT